MRLWLQGTLRQWQQHRFITLLLVLGYGLGIALTTLVYAVIAGRAAAEREGALGDPLRLVDVTITRADNGTVPLDPDGWTDGVRITWGWLFLYGKGGAIDPAVTNGNVVALFGDGPVDYSPPVRSGRFLTGQDLVAGAPVMAVGMDLPAGAQGFEVVGTVYDQPGRERGWNRDVFLPYGALPRLLKSDGGGQVLLHLEVAPGENLEHARDRIAGNLRQHLPDAAVEVRTVTDQMQSIARRFQGVYATGLGFSALLLGLVALNVGTLSIHWVTQRRRELGVRMALGATTGNLVGMILFEHTLVALIGAAVGLPGIWLGLTGAARAGVAVQASSDVAVVAAGAALFSGLISCLLPLRVLLRAPITEHLRFQD